MTIKQEIKAWAFVAGSKTKGFSIYNILRHVDNSEMFEIYLKKPKPRRAPFNYFSTKEQLNWKPKQITISFKI